MCLFLFLLCLALQAHAREVLPYCADPDWWPYEVINQKGEHQGIAADLLALVAKRGGIDLRLVPTATWQDSLEAARDGRCRGLSFLNASPARQQWLIFTDPLFADPNVIITREDHAPVADLSHEAGAVLVLPEGTAIEEWVRRDFPGLRVVVTADEAAAFAMVSDRRADMTIRSMTVAVDTIKRQGWFNLKVAGRVPGYDNLLRMGVRLDQAALVPLLNQGIAAITPQERAEIANRHVSITVRTGLDPDMVRMVVGAIALVALTSLFWGLRLRAANIRLRRQSRTDALTGIGNRAFLNDRLDQEVRRAARSGAALSVLLLDMDHFKRVNDQYGHLTGDAVLVDLAALLRREIRDTDALGRWGGEEFLILCPETGIDQVRQLGERIRSAAARHAFATGQRHSLSGGVAQWRGGESPQALLIRADQALYRAKDLGRDRIEAETV